MADFAQKTGKAIIGKGIPSIDRGICGNPRSSKPDIGPFEYTDLRACPLIGAN
jgi:hypothetical protein